GAGSTEGHVRAMTSHVVPAPAAPIRRDFAMPDSRIDEPEFTDEQLRAALKRVGEDARRAAFAGGQPIFIVRDSSLIAVYEDGTERVIERLERGNGEARGHE